MFLPRVRTKIGCALILSIGVLSGCASGRVSDVGQPDPERHGVGTSGGWERSLTPFPVLREDGTPYEIPFLGGFNVPRPQWADIDLDGDIDLVVQETTDRLLYFEREDTPNGPKHTWRPDVFSSLRVGEWYRFVDVDADGDRDLLACLLYTSPSPRD